MTRTRRLAAASLTLLGSLAFTGLSQAQRSSSPGSFALELAGAPAGILRNASGGEAVGDVVTDAVGGGFAKKHIGHVRFSDLLLEVGPGMEPAVYAWIASAWEGKSTRTSGAVLTASYNLQVVRRQDFHDAFIAETTIPACDAASKEAAFFTVRVASEAVRLGKGGGSVPSTLAAKAPKAWLASNFRLEIPGLDCTRVRTIDAIHVRTAVVRDEGRVEPGAVNVSDLVVALADLSAESWYDWARVFLVEGASGDAQEKNGVLIFLGPDGQSEIARVNLFGLGISSLRTAPAETAGQIRSIVGTLYCERASLEWKGGAGTVMNVRVFGR